MPTFDGGHYFLTALVPVKTDTIRGDSARTSAPGAVKDMPRPTSAVHALRKCLAMLPTAQQTLDRSDEESPFARNTRNHFVRFVVIDDVAYNGRNRSNPFVNALTGKDLNVAQPQDHLSCPFLLFAADFDAASGDDKERDSYLATLWDTMRHDLHRIFGYCHGFEARVKDAQSFAAYIADCQLETTMSFSDYYAVPPDLPKWPLTLYKRLVIAGGSVALLGIVITAVALVAILFGAAWYEVLRASLVLSLVGIAALAAVAASAYISAMAAGAKPFPAAPDSSLPAVLKALHLQRAFTRFVIDNQLRSVATDARSAQELYENFTAFARANKPDELGEPTQKPGVIGISPTAS